MLAEIVKQFGGRLGDKKSYVTFHDVSRRGYNEHLKLNRISDELLKKLKADFHFKLPTPEVLSALDSEREKKKIIALVNKEKVDIYKDNKLIMFADIYKTLYPDGKWLFISRPVEETFRSRFGEKIAYSDWKIITNNRLALWHRSAAANLALAVEYNDFKEDFDTTLKKIADHLNRTLTYDIRQKCRKIYSPRRC
jgi:hypothetical protein